MEKMDTTSQLQSKATFLYWKGKDRSLLAATNLRTRHKGDEVRDDVDVTTSLVDGSNDKPEGAIDFDGGHRKFGSRATGVLNDCNGAGSNSAELIDTERSILVEDAENIVATSLGERDFANKLLELVGRLGFEGRGVQGSQGRVGVVHGLHDRNQIVGDLPRTGLNEEPTDCGISQSAEGDSPALDFPVMDNSSEIGEL